MTKKAIAEFEARRLALQDELDAKKEAAERNRMGQFATPTRLAVDILRYAEAQLGKSEEVRFIDPAIGTGSFYSALLDVFPKARIGGCRVRDRPTLRRAGGETVGQYGTGYPS